MKDIALQAHFLIELLSCCLHINQNFILQSTMQEYCAVEGEKAKYSRYFFK